MAKKKKHMPSGLRRYAARIRKATKGVTARIKKAESLLKKLKAEKRRKIHKIQMKLKRKK